MSRSWCAVTVYTSQRTTSRVRRNIHRGLVRYGAVQLDCFVEPATATTVAQVVTVWQIEAQGRPLGEMQRIFASFGINPQCVTYGSGRVLSQGQGAGEKTKRHNFAEELYRNNRELLRADLYHRVQALRAEYMVGTPEQQETASRMNKIGKVDTRASLLSYQLGKLVWLKDTLVAAWEDGRIEGTQEDSTAMNALLQRIARQAHDILTLLNCK